MEKDKIKIERNIIEQALMAVKDFIIGHRKLVLYVFIGLCVAVVLLIGGGIYYEKRQRLSL